MLLFPFFWAACSRVPPHHFQGHLDTAETPQHAFLNILNLYAAKERTMLSLSCSVGAKLGLIRSGQ